MSYSTLSQKAGKYVSPACELLEVEALTSILADSVSGGINPYDEDGSIDL